MMERGFWLNIDDVDINGLYGFRLPVDGARESRDMLGAPDEFSLPRPKPAAVKLDSSHNDDDGNPEASLDWSTGLSVCTVLMSDLATHRYSPFKFFPSSRTYLIVWHRKVANVSEKRIIHVALSRKISHEGESFCIPVVS